MAQDLSLRPAPSLTKRCWAPFMTIGINASSAFKKERTGVEEYTYQLIRHLAMLEESRKHCFILYTSSIERERFSFLTSNFVIKPLYAPYLWTQGRLAWEMLTQRPDVLFIPVHVLPLIHPRNSVVTIHGLEYEYYPKMYSPAHLRYLRWSTKYALRHARRIIAVSENTKRDLVELYRGDPDKIKVIHHGVAFRRRTSTSHVDVRRRNILFIGRLERKKNVKGLIQAFQILKKKHKIPHRLILIGPPGYGSSEIKQYHSLNYDTKIEIRGYVSEKEKRDMLKRADVFVLPSFYEGFGMPVLEAMAAGVPVVTSNVSSLPEIAGKAALLVDPTNIEQIAEALYRLISNRNLRSEIVERGYQNIERFSWEKCAEETLQVLNSENRSRNQA